MSFLKKSILILSVSFAIGFFIILLQSKDANAAICKCRCAAKDGTETEFDAEDRTDCRNKCKERLGENFEMAVCRKTCSTDNDCPASYGIMYECRDGYCYTKRCTSDVECQSRLGTTNAACDPESGLCKEVPEEGTEVSCQTDADCVSGVCADGNCYCNIYAADKKCEKKKEDGEGCTRLEECQSGKCGNNLCGAEAPGVGQVCLAHDNCVAGDCAGNKCYCALPLKGEGELCVGGECMSGSCVDSRCTTPPLTAKKICVQKKGEGERCKEHHECLSNYCYYSLCERLAPGVAPPSPEAPKERGIFTRGLSDACVVYGRCGTCDILVVANNVIGFALQIVGGLAVLAIVLGGVLYITSQGNQEQIQHAKMAITAAIIGTLIVLSTWLIVTSIVNALGYNVGLWYAPNC
jgi:hypothetical protein